MQATTRQEPQNGKDLVLPAATMITHPKAKVGFNKSNSLMMCVCVCVCKPYIYKHGPYMYESCCFIITTTTTVVFCCWQCHFVIVILAYKYCKTNEDNVISSWQPSSSSSKSLGARKKIWHGAAEFISEITLAKVQQPKARSAAGPALITDVWSQWTRNTLVGH